MGKNARMAQKKGTIIGQVTRQAKKMKLLRKSETSEQRRARLESGRLRTARARASESEQERAARNEANRIRQARARASESAQKRAIRLEKNRLRQSKRRLTS
ncbi:uncharacterized protein isoform X1 [Rhodnius prolixus]|uniref:Uncharacterized protein n=2 Tax=Rhodnius prolixus TaxID=13249 RepID=A0A4P6DCE1_RHOPR